MRTVAEVKAMTRKVITCVLFPLIVFLSLQLDVFRESKRQAALPGSKLALLAPLKNTASLPGF